MIPILNIYYMLSYAFKVLNEDGYKNIETESFDNVLDLLSSILIKGVSVQLKRGLLKEYVSETEEMSTLRGKIDFNRSIKSRNLMNKRLVCNYDEFSVNAYLNRVIKTTLFSLFTCDISKNRKKEIRKILIYFDNVEMIDIKQINWSFAFNKNNQSYQMLVAVCRLIINETILSETEGYSKLMTFKDEQAMHRLYEKFVFEYYKKEHPYLKVNASHIKWGLDDDFDFMLPTMRSDITIEYNNKILIIDAKYYQQEFSTYYETSKIRSEHLYQIFSYVKNKSIEIPSSIVSGMILYAKTGIYEDGDYTYAMSSNNISVKMLDLNLEFDEIRRQLDTYISDIC